jgi:DNA-binding NarL/FixJ family response regulator
VDLPVQIITAHPLVAKYLAGLLIGNRKLGKTAVLPPVFDLKHLAGPGQPHLFVVDALALPLDLSALMRLLRVRNPGSRFLVLIVSDPSGEVDVLRLLHRGVDGVVLDSDPLQQVLPEALRTVLEGGVWAPPQIRLEYERQVRLLLNLQILPDASLTGRETQILQLVIRRMSNQEIADALGIKERTVRFHVFNIFNKLRVEDRGALHIALERLTAAPV